MATKPRHKIGVILTLTAVLLAMDAVFKIQDDQNKKTALADQATEGVTENESSSDRSDPAGFDYEYTGFLDEHPDYKEYNPAKDYDHDGTLDRIYKQYNKKEDTNTISLYFGNGKVLELVKNAWGFWYDVKSLHLTGSNSNDLIFYQYSFSTAGMNLGVSIFTSNENGYQKIELPNAKEGDDKNTESDFVNLPIKLTRLSDDEVKLEQPDTGYTKIIKLDETIEEQKLEHLWNLSNDKKQLYYPAQDCEILSLDESGGDKLRFSTWLGDKWCALKVQWDMVYDGNQLKIKKVLAFWDLP